MTRPLLVLLCAMSAASAANAKVTENLEFTPYDVDATGARSLVKLMNQASPHRVDGNVVYGMTRYKVGWQVRWKYDATGACTLDAVETRLDATISMPRLGNVKPAKEQKVATFLAALKVHEMGHYAIGQQAAAAVDASIQAVPTKASCDELKSAVDAAGAEAMARYSTHNVQYDLDTQQGKTQGAWLYD